MNLRLVQGFMRWRKEVGRSQCDRLSRSAVVEPLFISARRRWQHAAQLVGTEVNDGNLATDSLHGTSAFYKIPSASLIWYRDSKIYRMFDNGSSDRQKTNHLWKMDLKYTIQVSFYFWQTNSISIWYCGVIEITFREFAVDYYFWRL